MNLTVWPTLALVLVSEGLGPMLHLKAWKKMISTMTSLPDSILRRFGGGFMAAGIVVYYMLKKTIDWTKNRLIEVTFECKKYCNSERAMVESTSK